MPLGYKFMFSELTSCKSLGGTCRPIKVLCKIRPSLVLWLVSLSALSFAGLGVEWSGRKWPSYEKLHMASFTPVCEISSLTQWLQPCVWQFYCGAQETGEEEVPQFGSLKNQVYPQAGPTFLQFIRKKKKNTGYKNSKIKKKNSWTLKLGT